MLIVLRIHVSQLTGFFYHCWTFLSVAACLYFIPAPPVVSSLSLNNIALTTTDLLKLEGKLNWMVPGEFVNLSSTTRCSNCHSCGFVLIAFFHSNELIGIPYILSCLTVAVLRAPLPTDRGSPSSIFAIKISAGAANDVWKDFTFGHMVNWSLVPDQLHGQLAGVAGICQPFLSWRHLQNLDLVLGCDPHHLSLPSPHYLCLFLFSLALSEFCIIQCLERVGKGRAPGMAASDGVSQSTKPHWPASPFICRLAGSSHLSTVNVLLFCHNYCRSSCWRIQYPGLSITSDDAIEQCSPQPLP